MHDPERDIRDIPLSQLELSPANVRKTPADASAFTELKASIAAHGLLENLIARAMEPGTDCVARYAVIAGGRRLAAMQALAAEGALDEDHPVLCRMIGSIVAAEEVSLAENSVRAAMHPADQVEAFRRLADAGSTAAAIAARFGVSERTVEKRLRLGNAAPVLLEAYRAGEIDLEMLMAFAATTDHARQNAVWETVSQQGSCPDLELVLPARKEAVETPFLEEMREAARLAVYRTMAQADPAPRVAWTDWHTAKEAGIEMPEPPAELRPWRPAIADTDYWDERSAFTAVGSGALVMQADPEPPEAQALHRALGLTGLQGGSKPALRLLAPEPRFEGYPWYDALARVTGIETLVTVDGAVRSLDYFTNRENGGEPERPEDIVMHLNILHPPESPRHCFRKCGTIAVPADLAFAGEAWSSLHDALPLVTADSGIAPEELARLLRAAYFSPSDDAEADSWETQLTRFEEEALHMSLKLMCSVEEARQRTIADAVWREIFWLMPRDRTVTIVVRGGKVSVDIGPLCTEAATDAGNVEVVQ